LACTHFAFALLLKYDCYFSARSEGSSHGSLGKKKVLTKKKNFKKKRLLQINQPREKTNFGAGTPFLAFRH
jgi:hypothetical protein